MHPRLPDWAERLAALIEERRHAPFAWGSHDCALFAADAALAVTGRDPAAAWRGSYATEAEAEALLGESGLETFAATAMEAFGAPECPPAFAQRGDVVVLMAGNQPTCGVCLGAVVAAPGPDGLVFLPARTIRHAWAV